MARGLGREKGRGSVLCKVMEVFESLPGRLGASVSGLKSLNCTR